MRAVVFEPHMDDSVLFFAYGLLEFRPHVVTVFGNAQYQAPQVTSNERELEQARAFANLGSFEWTRWLFTDTAGAGDAIRYAVLSVMEPLSDQYEVVFAPLVEIDGHEQHNLVGECCEAVFGDRVKWYATYRRGERRTHEEYEVTPEPGWAALKFAAMSCYSTQIENPATRPWFQSADCLREWRA